MNFARYRFYFWPAAFSIWPHKKSIPKASGLSVRLKYLMAALPLKWELHVANKDTD